MADAGVLSSLAARGIKAKAVPVSRLPQLRHDIESLHEKKLLNEEVYSSYLANFVYAPPESMLEAKTIIIASVPQPIRLITFSFKGRRLQMKVPPTYAKAQDVIDRVRSAAAGCFGADVRLEKAALPLKTLAARTGLVRYGLNNITYLPDVGSFHRLVAFYCDRDLGVDHWQEREVLPTCAKCHKCIEACPTQALSDDRFLAHIERCLTYRNEMPSDRPFPRSFKHEWHNAIVGCMTCQEVCPHDRPVWSWTEEGNYYSDDETAYLLRGDFENEEAKEIKAKLDADGLELGLFPRNLRALLDGR